MDRTRLFFVAVTCVLTSAVVGAQGFTGALIATVKDPLGNLLAGARVNLSSPALFGGTMTLVTNETGQARFRALPPGTYALDIVLAGFETYREPGIPIGVGVTIERVRVLPVAPVAQSVVVEGAGSRIDARDPGFASRFGPDAMRAIPSRRSGMPDFSRTAPGVSPTSPSSGTVTTVSVFGSGVNENMFLIDGTNTTCPCNGVARAEIGVDFIHEVQMQSAGASAEFGNVQGAVFNIVTRSGSNRFLADTSYYGQAGGLTSQPVRLALAPPATGETGYERIKYRDFTGNVGGPAIRDRLWFFGGYQYLRDSDSQPGTDPQFPRAYEQNKFFGKLTWQLAPGWQLVQSIHDEFWVNPDRPTLTMPFETTLRLHATVPAITFGHLTHVVSANTLWDVRVGRFTYRREDEPSAGPPTSPGHVDSVTGFASGAPREFGGLNLSRATVKAGLVHYRPDFLGAGHDFKTGVQVERGEHQSPSIIPLGVRYVDNNGRPSLAVTSAPSNTGGVFITAGAYVTDAITLGERVTVNAGLRFDRSRAISQDLRAVDLDGNQTDTIVQGLGTLYTWNIWSPRLGLTARLTADGRAVLRASYGRYSQGVLTGEFGVFHPGAMPVTTTRFNPATGGYTIPVSVVDSSNLQLNPNLRAPSSDEYSVGVDREIGHRVTATLAYVRKDGANFIGWTDTGGQYVEETRTVNGQIVPVYRLVNATSDRRFLLTNPPDYALTYNGIVMALEKRRSKGWQAFGSYTFSRAHGLQASSGATAAGAQASTVAPPPAPAGLTFGRDPNDLTNARGLLPNDRPHLFRAMGALDVPRTGLVVAANLQYASGKPWAASAQFALPQGNQRVLLETRGTRRLSSQTLLDLRVSKTLRVKDAARIELLFDVLNLLNETAEEGLASDNQASATFGQPTVFVDPRRVMLGVRLNFGR